MPITISGSTGIAGVDGSAATPAVQGTDTNTGIAFPAADTVAVATGGTERMRVDSSGNVGIGTSSPTNTLSVSGSMNASNYYMQDSSAAAAGTYGFANSNGPFIQTWGNSSAQAGALLFATSGSERARIDASGNVGIGTSSPGAKLDIVTGGTGNFPLISSNSTNSTTKYGGFAVKHYTNAEEPFGAVLAYSDSGNNVLSIGGSQGEYNAATILRFYTAGNNTTITGTERARITAGGAFMVNTTTEYGRVTVRWDNVSQQGMALIATSETYNGSPIIFYNSSAGLAGFISQSTSSVSYNTSSDYRLKQNIVPLIDAAARVQALKPSRFNFIADPARTFDGFIAHEVAAVVPEAVHGEKDAVNDDGSIKPQGIDHSKLVPLLTAALQEALTKITALEARLTALEAK